MKHEYLVANIQGGGHRFGPIWCCVLALVTASAPSTAPGKVQLYPGDAGGSAMASLVA